MSWRKKKGSQRPSTTPPARRKLRFDPAHPRVPRPLHRYFGKDRPDDRGDRG